MNFLSASNHCIVQIVASSEILINFQQQVVQEQGKVTKTETRQKMLSNLIDKNTLDTKSFQIVEIKIKCR